MLIKRMANWHIRRTASVIGSQVLVSKILFSIVHKFHYYFFLSFMSSHVFGEIPERKLLLLSYCVFTCEGS